MFNIPNVLTLLNLSCGCLATICAMRGDVHWMLTFFGAALVFDLLDGLAARALGLSSALGAELDSLADMVSFGFFPGFLMGQLLSQLGGLDHDTLLPEALGFIFTLAAGLRLAKFNLDDRQTIDFIGLNTPTATLALVGIYWNAVSGYCPGFEWIFQSTVFIICAVIVSSALLLIEIPMLSLKPSRSDSARTRRQVILLVGVLILGLGLKSCALPFIVLWYILFSFVHSLLKTTKHDV